MKKIKTHKVENKIAISDGWHTTKANVARFLHEQTVLGNNYQNTEMEERKAFVWFPSDKLFIGIIFVPVSEYDVIFSIVSKDSGYVEITPDIEKFIGDKIPIFTFEHISHLVEGEMVVMNPNIKFNDIGDERCN